MTLKRTSLLRLFNLNWKASCVFLMATLIISCNNNTDAETAKAETDTLQNWLNVDIKFNSSASNNSRNEAIEESEDFVKNYVDSINKASDLDYKVVFNNETGDSANYKVRANLIREKLGTKKLLYDSVGTPRPPCPPPPPGVVGIELIDCPR